MGSRSWRVQRSERDTWNYFNGNGRRHAIRRRKKQEAFERQFKPFSSSDGMYTFLGFLGRDLTAGMEIHPESRLSGMKEMDLDAMRFLRRWGRMFKPFRFEKPAPEPKRKGCFLNATSLAYRDHKAAQGKKNRPLREKKRDFVYVEGVAFGTCADFMSHAWNAVGVKGVQAVDWTWYAVNHLTLYFGIPFTYPEHQRLCKLVGHRTRACSFFNKTSWSPQLKREMTKILLARKRADKKIPKKSVRPTLKPKKAGDRALRVFFKGRMRGSFYLLPPLPKPIFGGGALK